MKPLLVIGGPTASGKTALAVELALKFGGEIVSADSMQIYKYMDIGSAKPDLSEKKGVPHHMMDIAEPTVNFSLGDYLELARKVIDDIHERGKLPIVAGGTGLYIDSVVKNTKLEKEAMSPEIREKLKGFAAQNGQAALHKRLAEIDPESAERIHPNNVKRVMRALEVYEATGKTMTENIRESKQPAIYKVQQYGILYDREVLYDRINKRVDIMFEKGLVEEVKSLVRMGCTRENTSMQGIGYKEVLDYLEGLVTKEEMTENIKQSTRRYAKRQMTWFNHNGTEWISPDNLAGLEDKIKAGFDAC